MTLSTGRCGRKQCYLTREDAIVAASTQLKVNKRIDYDSFRVYFCQICRQYHLTTQVERGRERREVSKRCDQQKKQH